MIRSRLHANPVAVQYPLGKEETFKGIIDLLDEKAILYRDETLGAEYTVGEIPAEYKDIVHDYREKIIEAIAHDKKFLGGKIQFVLTPRIGEAHVSSEVTMEDIREAIAAL